MFSNSCDPRTQHHGNEPIRELAETLEALLQFLLLPFHPLLALTAALLCLSQTALEALLKLMQIGHG